MFKETALDKLDKNLISAVRDEWMLVAAGDRENYNMMTASWGFFGEMWGKDGAVCAVRPTRYTYSFTEANDQFALCFLGDDRETYKICGSKSGRDVNNTELCGLTPVFSDGTVYFEECNTVIICKKLYADSLKEENFTDKSPLSFYHGDFHKLYFGEVVKVLTNVYEGLAK